MKKLVASFALVSVLSLASCLKSPETTPSPVAKGVELYNVAMSMQHMALDPANVAFRLSIYLAEAKAQSIDITSTTALNDWGANSTVTVGSRNINLRNTLFSFGVTFEVADGVYTVIYPNSYYSESDVIRHGKIIIDTNGKTNLYEFESGDEWEISLGADEVAYPVSNSYGSAGYDIYVRTVSSYTISYADDELWWIDVVDLKSHLEGDQEVLWSANERVLSYNWDGKYASLVNASTYFSVWSGSTGEGNSVFNTDAVYAMRYIVDSDITFRPACSWTFFESGTETVEFTALNYDKTNYPGRYVTVDWYKGTTACTKYADVTYNGFVERR